MVASIDAAGLTDQVELINFDQIVLDYHQSIEIYADPVHLNNLGRARLTKHLARVISDRLARDQREQLSRDLPVLFASAD